MTSVQRVWMTKQTDLGRQSDVAALRSRPCTEVPDDVGDYGCDVPTTRREGHRSIAACHHTAVDTAVDEIRHDEGIVEPGMVLTVSDDDTGEIETLLVGTEVNDLHGYLILSPLGRAIAETSPGERRSYAMPGATNRRVTVLHAVPYREHVTNCVGYQEDRPHDTQSHCPTRASTHQKSNPFWTTALCTAI
jgi:transcription elongation factor GreA